MWGLFTCQVGLWALDSRKFPVFSLMIREFDAESISHQTATSAKQSVLFTYNLEIAANPRVTPRFCARCEPEKAISLRIERIPRVFSLSAEEAVRFTVWSGFRSIYRGSEIRALRL